MRYDQDDRVRPFVLYGTPTYEVQGHYVLAGARGWDVFTAPNTQLVAAEFPTAEAAIAHVLGENG